VGRFVVSEEEGMTLLHLVPGEPLRAIRHRGCEITLYADRLHDRHHTGDVFGYKITDVASGKIIEAANGLRDESLIVELAKGSIDAYDEDPWEA
jgi:hypothetical protein